MGASKMRWIVGAGALLVAAIAFYVLLNVGSPDAASRSERQPALDDIDAESRAAMRELLREAGEE